MQRKRGSGAVDGDLRTSLPTSPPLIHVEYHTRKYSRWPHCHPCYRLVTSLLFMRASQPSTPSIHWVDNLAARLASRVDRVLAPSGPSLIFATDTGRGRRGGRGGGRAH